MMYLNLPSLLTKVKVIEENNRTTKQSFKISSIIPKLSFNCFDVMSISSFISTMVQMCFLKTNCNLPGEFQLIKLQNA